MNEEEIKEGSEFTFNLKESEPKSIIDVIKNSVKDIESKMVDLDIDLADVDAADIADLVDMMLKEAGEGPHVILLWREYWMILLGSEKTATNCGHQLFMSYQKATNLLQSKGALVEGADVYSQDQDCILISTYKNNPVFILGYEIMEVK